jgi:hypothetical protein
MKPNSALMRARERGTSACALALKARFAIKEQIAPQVHDELLDQYRL